jgi:HSP20 family protein
MEEHAVQEPAMVYQRNRSVYSSVQADDAGEYFVHVERLWTQVLHGRLQQPQYSPVTVKPAVDVYQTRDSVVVVVEAPGMRDQELRLELEGNRLTISGEKHGRSCREEGVFNQLEIACGPFSRTVNLPAEVDPDRVQLDYEDGYIEIRLPRVPQHSERRVRVTLRQT